LEIFFFPLTLYRVNFVIKKKPSILGLQRAISLKSHWGEYWKDNCLKHIYNILLMFWRLRFTHTKKWHRLWKKLKKIRHCNCEFIGNWFLILTSTSICKKTVISWKATKNSNYLGVMESCQSLRNHSNDIYQTDRWLIFNLEMNFSQNDPFSFYSYWIWIF